MKEVQDEVNKWETRMNTASRMLSKKQQRAQRAKIPCSINNKGDTQITCYRCGGAHKKNVCKIKREEVTCSKSNKQGHMTKVCKGGGKPTGEGKKGRNFSCATPSMEQQQVIDKREPPPEYAKVSPIGIRLTPSPPLTSTGKHRCGIPDISHS